MEDEGTSVGIGIDLGSTAVRVGLFNFNDDTVINITREPVPFYFDDDPTNLWQYTQDSEEIMNAIYKCFEKLSLDTYEVKSCGVSATCSMAVFMREGEKLIPFNSSSNDGTKNVVFWMDSSAIKNSQELNKKCPAYIRSFMGGNFIPEMGVPKLKRLTDHLTDARQTTHYSLELFDLHRYIGYELAEKYNWNYEKILNTPNTNEIGNDGELAGWSSSFYEGILKLPANVVIGPLRVQPEKFQNGAIKIASCIDCYSSWFSLCSSDLPHSLFVVGGTSTCYVYASSSLKSTIPGVWGPFTDIMSPYSVYETGQSCTGRLIEYLFETHPASSGIPRQNWPDLLKKIEHEIVCIENETQESVHFKTKNMFLYGDLQGNRTPYADPDMSGMFIGETTDTSFKNLVYKYVCVLECLAFQIKQMISIFGSLTKIKELRICGSQAENNHLLFLTSIINDNITIKTPTKDVSLAGVFGAHLLGKAASLDEQLFELTTRRASNLVEYQPITLSDPRLVDLLSIKYLIHLDMAKQQMQYRKAVSEALSKT